MFPDETAVSGQDSMAAQWERIAATDDSLKRRAFESAWLAREIERDPLSTLAFLREREGGAGAKRVARLWAAQDAEACATALPSTGDDWAELAVAALPGLVAKDSALAANLLKQLPEDIDPAGIDALAEKDLDLARDVLTSLEGKTFSRAQNAVAREWTRRDPDAALAWAAEIGDENYGQAAIRSVLVEWAKTDPFAAAEHIDLQTSSRLWGTGKAPEEAILAGMMKIDTSRALQWFQDKNVNHHYLPYAIRSFAGTDVSTAMGLARKLPAGKIRSDVVRELAVGPMGGYGKRVGEWLKANPTGDFANEVWQAHLYSLSYTDSEQALSLLKEIPDDGARQKIQLDLAIKLGNGHTGTAEQMSTYIRSLPESIREDALAKVISDRYGPNLGPAAYAQLLDDFPPGQKRVEAVKVTAGMWAKQPSAAIPWLQSLTDPLEQNNAYGAFAEKWASSDPLATSEWIADLPQGAPRDTAAKSLVGGIVETEPDSAFAWAQFISEEKDRTEALEAAYKAWRSVDESAAEAALKTLPASDRSSVKANLRLGAR